MRFLLIVVSLFITGSCGQEIFGEMFKLSMKKIQEKAYYLRNITSIIDVGANHADWTELMKKSYFPNADFFLIEGNSRYEIHFISKGHKYEIALVADYESENSTADFSFHNRYPTGGSIMPEVNSKDSSGFKVVQLQLTTIDSVLARHNVKPPELMKMDIQGAEFLALRGAEKTLISVDILIVEIAFHQYNAGAASFTDINLYLETQGFRIYDIGDFRHERWTYSKIKGLKKVSTLLQADVIWAKASSGFFTATKYPAAPASKYTCTYNAPVATVH
jgi:FkbM family methyltransferase